MCTLKKIISKYVIFFDATLYKWCLKFFQLSVAHLEKQSRFFYIDLALILVVLLVDSVRFPHV